MIGTLFGWRAAFWAIAVLCLGSAAGLVREMPSPRGDTGPLWVGAALVAIAPVVAGLRRGFLSPDHGRAGVA